jgi:hypothetical protein
VIPLAEPTAERLEELGALAAYGSVTPVIDRVLDVHRGGEAIRYLETERTAAKTSSLPPTPTSAGQPPSNGKDSS